MKKIIIIILSAILVGFIILFFAEKNPKVESIVPQISSSGTQPELTVNKESRSNKSLQNENIRIEKPSALDSLINLAFRSAKPVRFYGRIVDQFGQGVPGVKIVYSIYIVDSGGRITTQTDREGRFQTRSDRGIKLVIHKMNKSGYDIPFRKYSVFKLSKAGQHSGLWSETSPKNPFLYGVWRKTEGAAIIHGYLGNKFPSNDGFFQLGLLGIRGDIKIAFKTHPKGTRYSRNDWSVTIKSISGGLVESNDSFMYKAPVAGYKPEWVAEYKLGEKGWTDNIHRKFYFNVGQVYGKFNISVEPYSDPGKSSISGEYWINPIGTNLVFDKAKEIHMSR